MRECEGPWRRVNEHAAIASMRVRGSRASDLHASGRLHVTALASAAPRVLGFLDRPIVLRAGESCRCWLYLLPCSLTCAFAASAA